VRGMGSASEFLSRFETSGLWGMGSRSEFVCALARWIWCASPNETSGDLDNTINATTLWQN
jgi:hypothetical protein